MTLTLNVLDRLHVGDDATAATLVRQSGDGTALIELLELLWSTGLHRGGHLIHEVLERLSQLSPEPPQPCR